MANFKPQSDWMLLEPCAYESEVSNVIMPDGFKEKAENISSFRVLAVGPEAKEVKEGDEIITEGLATPMFQYKGEKHYVARAASIVFIVKE